MIEYDWPMVIHEAAHAEVGIRLGWRLVSMSLEPPEARLTPKSKASESGRRQLAIRTAGSLAELILNGEPTADAFEESLSGFFAQLGDHDIRTGWAQALGNAFGDDVWLIALTITCYDVPKRGWTEFRRGRAIADTILRDHWSAVEARALEAVKAAALP